MSITLSSRDVAALESAMETLLSPLGFDSDSAWQAAVCTRLRALTGADKALLFLPGDEMPVYADQFDPRFAADYSSYYAPQDEGWTIIAERKLGVFNVRQIVAGIEEHFHSTEIYNDLFVPHGMLDHLGVAFALNAETSNGDASLAVLNLQSTQEDFEPFGEFGLTIMRLLRPAFCAGVHARHAYFTRRRELTAVLDGLPSGAELRGPSGRTLHRNPALARLFQEEPRRGVIERAMDRTSESVRDIEACKSVIACRPYEIVRLDSRRYRIGAIRVPAGQFLPRDPATLVSVQRLDSVLPEKVEIVRSFGLTTREAEVALEVARGARNRTIARTLGITEKTTRHHTAHVLAKLGVGSRAEVAAALVGRCPSH